MWCIWVSVSFINWGNWITQGPFQISDVLEFEGLCLSFCRICRHRYCSLTALASSGSVSASTLKQNIKQPVFQESWQLSPDPRPPLFTTSLPKQIEVNHSPKEQILMSRFVFKKIQVVILTFSLPSLGSFHPLGPFAGWGHLRLWAPDGTDVTV